MEFTKQLFGLRIMNLYMLDKKRLRILQNTANKIRISVIKMSFDAQSAHMGGSLSCIDILTALYFYSMNINPKIPNDKNRDRLVFSKGHDAKALYATLCERGYFPKKLLETYEQNNGSLPGHSIRNCVPGIETSSGSLGHGLSISAGIAYAGKLDKKKYKVFTIISDGECDEGSTWEAILFAGHHKLNNLITIVDFNKLQGFGYTKDILNLEPFLDKWKSFNWNVVKINGHNLDEIAKALAIKSINKPLAIIANTIKGYKGPERHVNQISSQYKPPTKDDLIAAINRLEAEIII